MVPSGHGRLDIFSATLGMVQERLLGLFTSCLSPYREYSVYRELQSFGCQFHFVGVPWPRHFPSPCSSHFVHQGRSGRRPPFSDGTSHASSPKSAVFRVQRRSRVQTGLRVRPNFHHEHCSCGFHRCGALAKCYSGSVS